MANIFFVNEKSYTAKPFDFKMLREFGKNGVDLDNMANDPIPAILTYFMVCSGLDEETASSEITNVDDMEAITDALKKELDESGFFRSRKEGTKKNTATSKPKTVKSTKA